MRRAETQAPRKPMFCSYFLLVCKKTRSQFKNLSATFPPFLKAEKVDTNPIGLGQILGALWLLKVSMYCLREAGTAEPS